MKELTEVEARDLVPGLEEKFSLRELKRAFRRQMFIVHPDMGGTSEEFGLLEAAYNFLEKKVVHELGTERFNLQTVEGFPLTELGNGLPLTVSARECDSCEGRGYNTFLNYTRDVVCPDCKGDGKFWLPCKKCDGTGEYRRTDTNKVVGSCYLCGGSGRFYPIYKSKPGAKVRSIFGDSVTILLPSGKSQAVNKCRKCRGEGTIEETDSSRPTHVRCRVCNGSGELKIYNPVLPRGYIPGRVGGK